jgi:putative ATP-binding cassette transporter
MDVVLSYWSRAFYNSLQNKDWDSFIGLLLTYRQDADGFMPGFIGLATIYIAVAVYRRYLSQWLQISWRHWMTTRLLGDWLAQRAYYGLGLRSASDPTVTDNPDQRIAEDLHNYVNETLSLALNLLSTIVTLFSFITILWSLSGPISLFGIAIPGYMVWVALLYSAVGTALVHAIGRPLIRLNFLQQQVEANFRFSLVQVRENAEAIALSAGEKQEGSRLGLQFQAIRDNWRAIMTRTKLLNSLVSGFDQISSIFPIVVAAPGYFAGKLDLGGLTQTVGAFGRVQGAMSWFVNSYTEIASLRATIDRILAFQAEIAEAQVSQQGLTVADAAGDEFVLDQATLHLPDGRTLLDNGSLALRRGQWTALSGRSGSGKSTLFRALAGIWPYGAGSVQPGAGTRMFLPQRPYFPIGTLRETVSYPAPPNAYSDAEIEAALTAMGLPNLVARLDSRDSWGQRLSGGEQQRLAAARALLARPDWLFLDEATSSLDPASERAVLAALQERLPETAIVSIVHRPDIASLFPRRLVFVRDENGPGKIIDVTGETARTGRPGD